MVVADPSTELHPILRGVWDNGPSRIGTRSAAIAAHEGVFGDVEGVNCRGYSEVRGFLTLLWLLGVTPPARYSLQLAHTLVCDVCSQHKFLQGYSRTVLEEIVAEIRAHPEILPLIQAVLEPS